VVDPIIKANISSDLHDQLNKEQQFQVSKKLHEIRENLEYDVMMGHSPPLTEKQMNERLREEGLMLEEVMQVVEAMVNYPLTLIYHLSKLIV
jgi:hypothetical protein